LNDPNEKKTAVLVVDDDPQVCSFLRDLLEHEGYDVGIAGGFTEAVTMVHERSFDHVLIDFLYPEDPQYHNGIDVLHAVRRLRPNVRAYLMTGLAGNFPIEPIVSRGFDGFLAKPFTIETLRGLLISGAATSENH
jgi:CheY-like chemotaxis protein